MRGGAHPRAVALALDGQCVTVFEDPAHLAPRAHLGNGLAVLAVLRRRHVRSPFRHVPTRPQGELRSAHLAQFRLRSRRGIGGSGQRVARQFLHALQVVRHPGAHVPYTRRARESHDSAKDRASQGFSGCSRYGGEREVSSDGHSPAMDADHERQGSGREEEKEEWLAAHGGAPTHVVTFEPMYQIEVCIPPWEHPERQIARSAVAWGHEHEPGLRRRAPRRGRQSSPPTTRATRSRSTAQ